VDFPKPRGGQNGEIGLSILGTISAFSIWSAVNPSFFTIRAFNTPEHEKDVRFGMNAGLVLNGILGAALYMAYGKKGKWPGLLTAGTGVGLWLAYHHILKGAKQKGGGEKGEGWQSITQSNVQTTPGVYHNVQTSGGDEGEGEGEGDAGYGFMSKAQVKASGWDKCAACLQHGRTLQMCCDSKQCTGPWGC
jgi:hypothetical protein